MNIEIIKDTHGPYANSLHEYKPFLREIVYAIEKIGTKNIKQLDIIYSGELIRTQDDIKITSRAIIIKQAIKRENDYIHTKIIDVDKISSIEIWECK